MVRAPANQPRLFPRHILGRSRPAFRRAAGAPLASVLLAAAALLAACGGPPAEKIPPAAPGTPTPAPLRVGLVFDVGGLGDKSFNDGAYRGVQWGKRDHGIRFEYIEPEQASDRESGLRMLSERGYDLVIGVGFLFTEAITAVAREFPQVRYLCVDYDVKEGREVPANLLAATFREAEGACLVGAIAGWTTRTGVIGFVGGMDIPLIRRFEAGYRFGALRARPDARVLVNYAGETGEAFANPTRGKELGLSQYDAGADIVFHASGSTGLGVFQAAIERDRLAIGVDSDQSADAPGHILTSMLKRVDMLVLRTIGQVVDGEFKGGVRSFGLAEDALGYVRDETNASWLTDEVAARVAELRQAIESGAVQVPSTREELEAR